jgi:hypothetical protein
MVCSAQRHKGGAARTGSGKEMTPNSRRGTAAELNTASAGAGLMEANATFSVANYVDSMRAIDKFLCELCQPDPVLRSLLH